MTDPIETLATMLAADGPLDQDTITQRLRANGVADVDAVLENALDYMACPAGQLADERWIWVATRPGRRPPTRPGAAI